MAHKLYLGCCTVMRVGAQVAALWLLGLLSQALAVHSPVPLPAGAVGLVLLFTLLATGVLRSDWIAEGADLLVRHLALFLVPIAVGFMAFAELIAANGVRLMIVVAASTACGIAAAGWTAQAAARRPQRTQTAVRRSEP